jgi:cbb3-type cytochrome oxidase subunit 3
MYSQFLDHLTGGQGYLISSLGIFFVFFIVVTVLLLRLKKTHVNYMSDMPLEDDNTSNPFKPLQS